MTQPEKGLPVTGQEVTIRTEVVKLAAYREDYGDLSELRESMHQDGQRHPITLWTDCTLVSGGRRLRARLLDGHEDIRAVFVDNIEDAADRLIIDRADETAARPMVWSDVCRLWDLLRLLDEPNAVRRADAARRLGVELRKRTQSGQRAPGRSRNRGDGYVLTVLSKPFGIKEATASRINTIWRASRDPDAPLETRAKAIAAMRRLDNDEGSVWSNYADVTGVPRLPPPKKTRAVHSGPSKSAKEQLLGWSKALPVLEGLIDGLVALGPPAEELSWAETGPACMKLANARKELDKIIRKMKEKSPA